MGHAATTSMGWRTKAGPSVAFHTAELQTGLPRQHRRLGVHILQNPPSRAHALHLPPHTLPLDPQPCPCFRPQCPRTHLPPRTG
eukprot:899637-Rhodomonas_salina.1